MKYKLSLLAALLLGSNLSIVLPVISEPTPVVSPSAKVSSADLRSEALSKVIKGDHQGALKLIEQAIQQDPQDSENYVARAELKELFYKDFTSALADYDHAVKLNPTSVSTLSARSKFKLNTLYDSPGGIADLDAIIAIEPQEARHYLNRGIAYHTKVQEYKTALNDYNQAVQIVAKDKKQLDNWGDTIYYYRGKLKGENLNDLKGAIDDCNYLIKNGSLNTIKSTGYSLRGWLKYSKLKNFAGAEADFKISLKLQPNNTSTYNMRSIVRSESGKNIVGAMADLNRALKINTNDNLSLYNRGDLLYTSGRKAEALKDFQSIISDKESAKKFFGLPFPDEGIPVTAAGIIALENKSWDEALSKFDQARKEQPDSIDVLKYRGLAKLGQGDRTGATEDFKAAAQKYKDLNLMRSYRFVQNLLKKSAS